MQVVVSGASGLVGRALCHRLAAEGHEVRRLVRRPAGPGERSWDPDAGALDPAAVAGADAVVHLGGAGIGDRRWDAARRRLLVDSRVRSTSLLATTLAGLDTAPGVFVCASALGVYGDRGDEVLTESSPTGTGFLADLCREWEEAAAAAREAGVRTVHLRSGIVLASSGGALGKQLRLFRLGLGGRLGSGRQWTSWVSLDDEVAALRRVLDDDRLRGPVNVTAPEPVTNAAFTAALGRALHRPAVLAVPAPALRLVLGRGLADELVLASQRVLPAALEAAGFAFRHPRLPDALAAVLGG
ncbi:MAG: TIGR01777 family oxidoreductase [Acidobacteriota bacterium]|nr:TIGR01777 family oxidoreductase [Acidobacteriota bacterium]